MLIVCWAAKGGSGTTVTAAALTLSADRPTTLVDLDGDLSLVLGVDTSGQAGVVDWLVTDAPPDRLARLELPIGRHARLLPCGGSADRPSIPKERWAALGAALADRPERVIVDAGTGTPPAELCRAADASLLVTRSCYVAVRRAAATSVRPTGVVLIEEPGRRLGAADIEAAVGAPVVATVLLDPAIARAVDAGLLVSRLPSGYGKQLRGAA